MSKTNETLGVIGLWAALLLHGAAVARPQTGDTDPLRSPEVAAFLGTDGVGRAHPDAPEQLAHFGRLVGIWDVTQFVRKQDGSWGDETPAIWVWQYILDGFATQDLWLQAEEQLPSYLKTLGRSYQLTAIRMFDVQTGKWRVAFAANGGGTVGADFGTFEATEKDGEIVMSSVDGPFEQRITFSKITESGFEWLSGFRQGDQWVGVMRVEARRRK